VAVEARIVIIASKLDKAGMNILDKLVNCYGFRKTNEVFENNPVYELDDVKIVVINSETIYSDYLENHIKAEAVIFASRHKSEKAIPSLLAHVPGNWTKEALYGGKPKAVCIAPASLLREALLGLIEAQKEKNLDDWYVGLEVTHHGPYFEKLPVIFVELGSSEKEWGIDVAGEAVAHAIYRAAFSKKKYQKIAAGYGGPHYTHFAKDILETDIAIGHIIPKYVFDQITEREISMAIDRTLEKVNTVLIDWKGLKSAHRKLVLKVAQERDLEVIKT